MTGFLLRYGVLAVGLVFASIALGSWRSGAPPAWTTFVAGEPAAVVSAEVVSSIVNGATRYRPRVVVEHPLGSGAHVALEGLTPTFYGSARATAEEIVAAYEPGATTRVHAIDGALYAARFDLFQVGHAGFSSLFAAFLLTVGAIFFFGLRKRR